MNTIISRTIDWIRAYFKRGFDIVKISVAILAIFLFSHGPRQIFVWIYRFRRKHNKPIYVDRVPFTKVLSENEKASNATIPVPSPPDHYSHSFKARQMRRGGYPKPQYTYAYKTPPLSGKILSGIGDKEFRRVKKFYHNGYKHIYGAMEFVFVQLTPKKALRSVLKAGWDNTFNVGPVAVKKQKIDNVTEITAKIKSLARKNGASSVGCTSVTEESLYDHVVDVLPNAIVVAAPMDRETMLEIPNKDSGAIIIDGYVDVGKSAIKVAEFIRGFGWNAVADTNLMNAESKVLHIPLAVNAGLGQMGRHTSLITKEHGANVRLATVLTDLPLEFDKEEDIGVEDVCINCRICAENCPPKAIYQEKQMVRGIEKWHIDFDRCMPYFNEMDTCGICITVCPWSETGKGDLLSQLQKHRKNVKEYYPDVLPESERLIKVKEVSTSIISRGDDNVEDYWQDVIVSSKKNLSKQVIELKLSRGESNEPLPEWSPGAHTEIKLPSGKVRAYSICGRSEESNLYRFGIKIETQGNGGSLEINTLREGQSLQIKRPGNNFPLREEYEYYYLVAGGIGITPMIPMAERLKQIGKDFEIHYAVKSKDAAIYLEELNFLSSGKFHLHTERGWLDHLFDSCPNSSAVLVCGPSSLMDDTKKMAMENSINSKAIFSEDFGSTKGDVPFDVVLASSRERITVAPGQTISRALDEKGIYTPVSCGYGICGVCTAEVLEGEPDARDRILTESDKKNKITLCCSRSKSPELVIDL